MRAVPRKLTNFDQMWSNYPNPGEGSDAAKATIGGAVNTPIVNNTCVARISRSMNYSGHRIPANVPGLWTLRGADKLNYALRVQEMRRYLKRIYGRPNVAQTFPEPGGPVSEAFAGAQGIICFVVTTWSDATGHFDLWNGERCIHSNYFHEAASVELWTVPGAADDPGGPVAWPVAIGGTVGAGGANHADDVRTIQQLLIDNGEDPGPADGVMGPRTIAAIRHFQKGFLTAPDGRVDPDGRTWRVLNRID
jgi:hypothetical protein